MKIEIKSVVKKFKRKAALSDVSCDIAPGTVGAVIGLNGAGKTTLLRLLGGVLVANKGEVLFDGKPFDRQDMDFRRNLFFLPDQLPTLGVYSPLRHAAMVLSLYGVEVDAEKEKLMGLYERFDLLPCLESPMGMLSREQARKAAEKGSTVLFTTQILEIAEDFADVIYVLHQGELVEVLPVAELKARGGEGHVSEEVLKVLEKLRGIKAGA